MGRSSYVGRAARAALCALLLGVAPARARAEGQTDDEFIEALGDASNKMPVDRKRLARILFSLAATLDGGKSSVQLLQSLVVVPETSRQAVQTLLQARFGSYAESLTLFRQSVSGLLDEPESVLLLYRTIVDGQRTCWHLDLHNRLIETYGGNTDLVSILSSREACGRLRTALFQPRVEAMVREALVEQVYQRAQIDELKGELAELERLLDDLRRIDQSD